MQLRAVSFLGVLKKLHTILISGAIAALGLGLLTTTNTYAADASIKNGALTYQSADYEGPFQKTETNTNLPSGIPNGAIYYLTNKGGVNDRQTTYVYLTDKNAKKAEVAIYRYIPPDGYELQGAVKSISLDNDGSAEAPNQNTIDSEDSTNGCSSAFGALSWIVCTASEKLGDFVDWAYGIIADWFLVVKPLSFDENSPIYLVWSYMRSLANIVFIIFMLVVIYSQVTTVGMSNYGIKKTLPRIIIAAFLVNLSYMICAIAVDLSNIIGDQLHSMFMSIRDQAISAGALDITLGFKDLFLAAGGVGLGILGVSMAGGIWFLIAPVLLGAGLALLAAIVTLAARQAIIMLLVIASPLALVAYLLPNTEKWYKKWFETGVKMLIIFPAFSLLCGAAELAGWAIIASAQNIIQVVLGLAVQTIPLIFTPILMRLSGSLLGSIQSALNKRTTGLRDKIDNWGKDKRAIAKARKASIGKGEGRLKIGNKRFRAPTTALANFMAYKQHARELDKQKAEETAQSVYKKRYADETNTPGKARNRAEYRRRVASMEASASEANLNNSMSTMGDNYSADMHGRRNKEMYQLTQRMSKAYFRDELEKSRAANINTGDKAYIATKLNDIFATHDKLGDTPDNSEEWKLIQLAAGGRGTDGIQSIRAAAATQKDTEDQRMLKEREVQIGKAAQGNLAILEMQIRTSYRNRDAFGLRAAMNKMGEQGSVGYSLMEKIFADIHGTQEKRTYYNVDENDQDWKNLHGVWANHIANSLPDARKKAVDMWFYAKSQVGKIDDSNYSPMELKTNPATGRKELVPASVFLYTPDNPSENLIKSDTTAVSSILTGPGDLLKQSGQAIKNLVTAGVVTERAALRDLKAAAQDPAFADTDPEKLIMLGKVAGWIPIGEFRGVDWPRNKFYPGDDPDSKRREQRRIEELAAIVDTKLDELRPGGRLS
jgi:hypothetical protein